MGPVRVGLDPEAIGDEGAEAAEGGEKAELADLLAEAQVELRAVEVGGAVLAGHAALDGQAKGAEEE